MGYLESLLRTFHGISEQLSLANLIFNIQARSEDERVPAECDNFYQLERPNRPTRFTTDRATDRDAFLSHSCICEPCYQLTNGFRHLKKVKTQHHSALAFKSRFAFSVGIHVTLLAGVSPAKRQRAMSRVFQCKKRDAI